MEVRKASCVFGPQVWGESLILSIRGSYPVGVLEYFHTYIDSDHFWGFRILNFNIFGGFQKNDYFWGMKILWILFGVVIIIILD